MPVKGGTPKRVAKNGAQPMFGATNDRIFFTAGGDEDKQLLKSVNVNGSEEVTHLISQNAAEFALSPDEQFVAWAERYQAYVMPFVRSGRSIDIAPDGKALPQSQVSAPMPATGSTGRATAADSVLDARGRTCSRSTSAASGAFAGGKQAPAPVVRPPWLHTPSRQAARAASR